MSAVALTLPAMGPGGDTEAQACDLLLDSLLSGLDDAVVVVRQRDAVIAACNAAAERLLGYAPGALVGRGAECLFADPDERRLPQWQAGNEIGSRSRRRLELALRRRDGSRFAAVAVISPVTCGPAIGSAWVVTVRDPHLCQTGPGNDRTLAMLAAVSEAAPLAVITVDACCCVRTWSPAAESLLGWGESEARGKPLSLLLGAGGPDLGGLEERLLSGWRLAGLELALCRRDGEPLPVRLSAAPIADRQGRPSGAVVVIADLSDQRRVEAALRETEEREELLAHLATDLAVYSYRLKPSVQIGYLSPAATRITGCSVEDLRGRPLSLLRRVHPADRRRALAAFCRPVDNPGAHQIRWTRPDHSILLADVRNVPVYDEAGAVVAVEGVLRGVPPRQVNAGDWPLDAVTEWAKLTPLTMLLQVNPEGAHSMPWVSEGARTLLGVPAAEAQRSLAGVRSRLAPVDRGAAARALRKAATTGASALSVRWLCSDGRYHDLSAHCLRLPRTAAGVTLVMLSIVDEGAAGGTDAPPSNGDATAERCTPQPIGPDSRPVRRRVVLEFPEQARDSCLRPQQCPHCGCEALQRHQVTRRHLRDLPAEAEIVRYRCTACGRTFSQHPSGIERGPVSAVLRLQVAVLYGLGLSARRISDLLAASEVTLTSRSVSRLAGAAGAAMRQSKPPGLVCAERGCRVQSAGDLVIVKDVCLARGQPGPCNLELEVIERDGSASSWLAGQLRSLGVLVHVDQAGHPCQGQDG